jgi:hypothetical protein
MERLIAPDGGRGCHKVGDAWIPGCWSRVANDNDCICEARKRTKGEAVRDLRKRLRCVKKELERIERRLDKLTKPKPM